MKYNENVLDPSQPAPELKPGDIHVHKDEKGEVSMLELLCPCRCGDVVKVNTQTTSRVKAHVFKKYREEKSPYLFSPAMQRISGCKTRFIIATDGEMTFTTPPKSELKVNL